MNDPEAELGAGSMPSARFGGLKLLGEAVKKRVTNYTIVLCQLGMDDEGYRLLSFRADRDRWADRARTEAKAVRLALAEGAAGSAAAAAASRRLFRIVEFIRSANSRMIDAFSTVINEHSATPDEAEQFQDMADEIVALNTEMYALLLVNTAVLRAAMKRDRRRAVVQVYRPWPPSR
jgi:hypothetical protein